MTGPKHTDPITHSARLLNEGAQVSMSKAQSHRISVDARLAQLIEQALPGAQIVGARALTADSGAAGTSKKEQGYGAPLRIDVRVNGIPRSLVLHSATPNPFGHELRANRAEEMLIAADTFALLPHHTRVLDVGAYREDGFVSLRGSGEFYLLTEYAEGTPYASDLRRIARSGSLRPEDLSRLDALVAYLVNIHDIKLPEAPLYRRSIRDLLGSGEGIFGIVDGYPEHADGVDPAQLERIEALCLGRRWRLKHRYPRLVRIHGDFHPFNVLFDEQSELHLLDASRGSAGDAADDVTAMAVNFVFFALENRHSWETALQHLWRRFWEQYLALARDAELLEVAAPFLAWRTLVLANPVWYPDLDPRARSALLQFAESSLLAPCFDPDSASAIFRALEQ